MTKSLTEDWFTYTIRSVALIIVALNNFVHSYMLRSDEFPVSHTTFLNPCITSSYYCCTAISIHYLLSTWACRWPNINTCCSMNKASYCIDCIIISLLYTDSKKIPLGKLSKSQIAKGFEVIIEQCC